MDRFCTVNKLKIMLKHVRLLTETSTEKRVLLCCKSELDIMFPCSFVTSFMWHQKCKQINLFKLYLMCELFN